MTKRTMTLSINALVIADLDTEDGKSDTHIQLQDVRHSVIGTLSTPLEVDADSLGVSEEFRKVMAVEVTRLAVTFLKNKFEGKHEGPPPEINQPGALA